MSEKPKTPYCYVDHANKKSENYAATPYLFWLKQVRRNKDSESADEDDRSEETGQDDADANCEPFRMLAELACRPD